MRTAAILALALLAGGAAQAQTWDNQYGFEVIGALGDRLIANNFGTTFLCGLTETEAGWQLSDCRPVVEPVDWRSGAAEVALAGIPAGPAIATAVVEDQGCWIMLETLGDFAGRHGFAEGEVEETFTALTEAGLATADGGYSLGFNLPGC